MTDLAPRPIAGLFAWFDRYLQAMEDLRRQREERRTDPTEGNMSRHAL